MIEMKEIGVEIEVILNGGDSSHSSGSARGFNRRNNRPIGRNF